MTEDNEPEMNLYGQQIFLQVESVNFNSHREPTDYDSHNRPINWVKVTQYSLRFEDGGWITGQLVDCIVNIHRGDIFEVFECNNKYTFAKNTTTGEIFINSPFINPEWQNYMEEQRRKKKELWKTMTISQRIKKKLIVILSLTIIGSWISFHFKSPVPFILTSLILFWNFKEPPGNLKL